MKYYKSVTMAISSVLAIALLSGCDQNGDAAKEAASEPEAVVEEMGSDATGAMDKMTDAATTVVEDAKETMTDAATSVVEDTKQAVTDVVEGAEEKMMHMAEGAEEKMMHMTEEAEEEMMPMEDAQEKMDEASGAMAE